MTWTELIWMKLGYPSHIMTERPTKLCWEEKHSLWFREVLAHGRMRNEAPLNEPVHKTKNQLLLTRDREQQPQLPQKGNTICFQCGKSAGPHWSYQWHLLPQLGHITGSVIFKSQGQQTQFKEKPDIWAHGAGWWLDEQVPILRELDRDHHVLCFLCWWFPAFTLAESHRLLSYFRGQNLPLSPPPFHPSPVPPFWPITTASRVHLRPLVIIYRCSQTYLLLNLKLLLLFIGEPHKIRVAGLLKNKIM